MHWKILGGVLIVAVLAYGGYRIAGIASSLSLPSTEEEIAAVQAVAKQQIEDRHYRPKRQKN
ncbi:MAG: hypothetical protein VW879_09680, partial [Opitutae bacterium]